MNTCRNFKSAMLAASIMLAVGSTPPLLAATAPATDQLPGRGSVAAGGGATGTVSVVGGVNTLAITLSKNSVINWNNGSDINGAGTAGFNIGARAAVNFSGAFGALNVDSSGQPSRIFGKLSSAGNVFVANTNGIIVGPGATIAASAEAGLIANTLDPGSFTGTTTSLSYDGTGGEVTVQAGATLGSTKLMIAGGGAVNVDLGAVTGAVTLSAGLPKAGSSFTATNPAASVTVTAASTGSTVASLGSAGNATTNGKLTITAATNPAALAGSGVVGVLLNNGNLTLAGNAGKVHNIGQLTVATDRFTGLTNDGLYTPGIVVGVAGGDFINNGTVAPTRSILVADGSIVNHGVLQGVWALMTLSRSATITSADYSITNTGTITGTNDSLTFSANAGLANRVYIPSGNHTTGSVINSGNLQVNAATNDLSIMANNDINLGGLLQTNDGTTIRPVSATNALGMLTLNAAGYDQVHGFMAEGTLTVSTPVAFGASPGTGWTNLAGNKVKLMADVTGGSATILKVMAGNAPTSDYAIRIAAGTTTSADNLNVGGFAGYTVNPATRPNLLLQGTLAGNHINVGTPTLFFVGTSVVRTPAAPISDVVSGPAGKLLATGATPGIDIIFNGRLKIVPYLNDPNFRYRYLSITNGGTAPLALNLNPVAYQTMGTSNGMSGVNVLVNGDVNLTSSINNAVPTSAVTGAIDWENTHLVLQATGNIATLGTFYWPGFVYLGNIGIDVHGTALPGTLGQGTIRLGGDFSNVLPGNVDVGGGVHFISGAALLGSGKVTTNANSWINFGTDLLTGKYAQGAITTPTFLGGTVGAGNVVNYGKLDPSMFHSHPPVATH